MVVLHLGNGASACAVDGGRSVDTSMGLSPAEGLVMGTRSGDVDPALGGYLARVSGLSAQDYDQALNRESGLLGLSGVSDFRTLVERREAGDAEAGLAFDVTVHRIRKYVGAYAAVLGRLDALAFTGGIGERSAVLRAAVVDGLGVLGLRLDAHGQCGGSAGASGVGRGQRCRGVGRADRRGARDRPGGAHGDRCAQRALTPVLVGSCRVTWPRWRSSNAVVHRASFGVRGCPQAVVVAGDCRWTSVRLRHGCGGVWRGGSWTRVRWCRAGCSDAVSAAAGSPLACVRRRLLPGRRRLRMPRRQGSAEDRLGAGAPAAPLE